MKLLFIYIQLHHYKTFDAFNKTRGTRGKAPAKDTPNTLADLAGIWQKLIFGSALSANYVTMSLFCVTYLMTYYYLFSEQKKTCFGRYKTRAS